MGSATTIRQVPEMYDLTMCSTNCTTCSSAFCMIPGKYRQSLDESHHLKTAHTRKINEGEVCQIWSRNVNADNVLGERGRIRSVSR